MKIFEMYLRVYNYVLETERKIPSSLIKMNKLSLQWFINVFVNVKGYPPALNLLFVGSEDMSCGIRLGYDCNH